MTYLAQGGIVKDQLDEMSAFEDDDGSASGIQSSVTSRLPAIGIR